MSDNNLRLQVILNAVDKLTRPFRSAQASSRELAAAVKKSRDAIKQLDQAGSSLDSFRKLQAENQKLGDRLNYARQRANLLSQELGAMGPPSQRQVVAWAVNGWLFSAWKNARKSCSSRRRLCVLNCTGREFLRKTMREQLPV
ncbi:hypothetical protein ABE89_009490 [Escherichia coli]|nr:hypothetical protein ABE89_009490 [Escherichia coli]